MTVYYINILSAIAHLFTDFYFPKWSSGAQTKIKTVGAVMNANARGWGVGKEEILSHTVCSLVGLLISLTEEKIKCLCTAYHTKLSLAQKRFGVRGWTIFSHSVLHLAFTYASTFSGRDLAPGCSFIKQLLSWGGFSCRLLWTKWQKVD